MTRTGCVFRALSVSTLTLGILPCVAQPPLPNVIVVLSDDMGPGDFAVFDNTDGLGRDSRVPTPALDRLAADGMRFRHAHATASLCAPTRAATLAGCNTWHTRTEGAQWGMGNTAFAAGQWTVGDMMQSAGYRTAFFGKQHTGGTFYQRGSNATIGSGWANVAGIDFERPIKDGLQDHGFHFSLGLTEGIQGSPYLFFRDGLPIQMDEAGVATPLLNSTYTNQVRQWAGGTYNSGQTVINSAGWGATDWNTMAVPRQMLQNAVDFMRDSVSNHSTAPFFVYYASVAAHVPQVPDLKLAVDINGDGDTNDVGEVVSLDGYDGTGPAPDDLGTVQMRMIRTCDAEVGALLEFLGQTDDPREPGHKLVDNSLMIFMSDNGGLAWGAGEAIPPEWTLYGHDPTAGLRDRKGSIYEGGTRVPFVAMWPGRIEAGAVRDQLIATHDVMGTLAALTGQWLPDQALDSFNMLPVLLGQQGDDDPVRSFLITQHISGQGDPKGNVIYDGEWKLLVNRSDLASPAVLGLYDLAADPAETNNLQSSSDAGIQARLSRMYDDYVLKRNASRSAPAFIPAGTSVAVSNLAGLVDVTVGGALSGCGLIPGTLECNTGSRIGIGAASNGLLQVAAPLVQDSNIKALYADTNYNGQRIAVGTTGAGVARGLLAFDLVNAGFPPGGALTGVGLILTVSFHQGTGPQNHTLELHRLGTPFLESETTWNAARTGVPWGSPGGDLDGLLDSIPSFDPTTYNGGDTLLFSGPGLQADVQANLTTNHYGLLLKLDAGAEAGGVQGSIWAHSKELGSPAPQLYLTFAAPLRTLTVGRDFVQRQGSTLEVELAGTNTAGLDYDLLSVGGSARLDGNLSVRLAPGFTPALGDVFTILNAQSVTGAFHAVDGVVMTTNLASAFRVHHTSNTVMLETLTGGVSADGTPLWWLADHELASSASDVDGDGFTQAEEYRANTDPNDPFDFLSVALGASGDLSWSMQPDRQYTVQRSLDLIQWEDWQEPSLPVEPGVRSIPVPFDADLSQYFRIRCRLPL